MNWILLKIIKARLDEAKGTWLEELPNVLWAYGQQQELQQERPLLVSPMALKAVIPIKVGIASLRREAFHEGSNDDQLRVNLDCLVESRDGASCMILKYQQKMSEYYNRRVKLRRLNIRDLVLRKVTLTTKNPTQGKLDPTWKDPTESPITPGKRTITWRRWTRGNCHDHGILSIWNNTTSRCSQWMYSCLK